MSKVTGILNNHHEALRQLATGQPPTAAQRLMSAASHGNVAPMAPISGLINENLRVCHIVLNALNVPKAPADMSLDGGLNQRLTWLLRQEVTINVKDTSNDE